MRINGVDLLQEAYELDPTFVDPLIGIGKYKHWKGSKLPRPFASGSDKRDGIRMLEEVCRRGARWQEGAVQTLAWIYIADKRWDDTIALTTPMVNRHPRSRFFIEILARAYEGRGDYARSEQLFQRMLDGLSPEERQSNFITMKYQRWIAKLASEQHQYERACRTALALRKLQYPGVHHDWLDRKTGLINEVLREACPKAQTDAIVSIREGISSTWHRHSSG